jgi:serine/threonine-protein kinase RsbW
VLTISTADRDLERLYPWLDEQDAVGNLPKATTNAMHIALEEAVMNVAMHGFPPGDPGEVSVQLDVSATSASLVVEDTGRAFDPTTAADRERPANLLEAEPGGLGLTLLRHYCKDIHYERVGERNRLTLRFPL